MAFPQSFLDELRNRVSIAEVVGRRVPYDMKRSRPGQGDFWGCCPFHGEKTPSFHVRERDGYFHCFGCGEKGSALDFVMKIDNLSFREAVTLLAGDAGMSLPEENPRSAAREQKRAALTEVMGWAVEFFQQALAAPAGRAAAEYLARRGLSAETIRRFGLGYAPGARDALSRALRQRGATDAQLVDLDLSMRPDDGGAPFDRFRDRIMFPILDAQGRVIAFGGRAMSTEARAKYLNSRETQLFSKGRVLFNYRAARAAARETPLIVVEGYMDAITLVAAGFETAVAPLGTALTEDQLGLLWKVCDEPVIALDGDEAGLRAAHRVADLALERLTPGKSVNFALMPSGRDPDDVIRDDGAPAMRALLDGALPLIELLWRREIAITPLDTPERRAALETRIEALTARIPDEAVRRHYRFAFKDRRFELFRPRPKSPQPKSARPGRDARDRRPGGRAGPGGSNSWGPPPGPTEEALSGLRALSGAPTEPAAASAQDGYYGDGHSADGPSADGVPAGAALHPQLLQRWRERERAVRHCERVLIAAALKHPWLAEKCQAELDSLEFLDRRLDTVRNAILTALAEVETSDAATSADGFERMIEERIGGEALAAIEAEGAAHLPKSLAKLESEADAETAFLGLLRVFASRMARLREGQEYVSEILPQEESGAHVRLDGAQRAMERSSASGEGGGEDQAALSRRLIELSKDIPKRHKGRAS